VEQLLSERNLLREEASQLSLRMSDVLEENSNLKDQVSFQISKFSKCQDESQKAGEMFTKIKSDLEGKVQGLQEELETIRDSSDDNISTYNAKLEQKDKIIEELKMQLSNLTKDFSSGNDQVEMQQKDEDSLRDGKFNAKVSNMPVVAEPSQIEILTNTLLEKHALLEAVTAEKNILALKVEKLEENQKFMSDGRYVKNGKASLISRVDNHAVDSSSSYYSDTDKSSARRSTLKKSKFDALDKLSFKIGATLRRYPSARIFILLYMMIMHIWLFIVLFSSVPSESVLSARASYHDDETSNQNNDFVHEDKLYK